MGMKWWFTTVEVGDQAILWQMSVFRQLTNCWFTRFIVW